MLKNLSYRKYSFQKLTQFSQGNNVLDALASNTASFISRDICVFKLAKEPIWKKENLSPTPKS
jgi:hypothetical protein